MAALETIAPEAKEAVALIGEADLVAALPACLDGESLAAAVADLGPVLSQLLPHRRTVLLYPDSVAYPAAEGQAALGVEALSRAQEPGLSLLPFPLIPVERPREQLLEHALRATAQVGRLLGARAHVVLGSEAAGCAAGDLRLLAEPILNHGYDLAVPLYARRKFAGLINSAIVYPLTRALYGMRLHNPMAPDLAFSARLADRELHPAASGETVMGWLPTRAVCSGLQVCQVHHAPVQTPAGPDSPDVSAALAQILSRLFTELERTAGIWQRVRGSHPVRAFGSPPVLEYESSTVDVHSLVETFQRGCRDLLPVWGMVLTPATLVELRKIAKLPVEQFRIADELWAHVLYDFVLGHRQRAISREHLLRSLTPIYLGWVASYALEVQDWPPEAVDARLEKMCVCFEQLKPYLLSRWRWPDRFNP